MKTYRTDLLIYAAIALKFLLFDLFWALPTTFSGFSYLTFWLSNLLAALLCALPALLWRRWSLQYGVAVLLDLLFVCNLMYFRTYYTSIPLSSYLLVSNLRDFTDSVYASLHWGDLLFPLTTLLLWPLQRTARHSSCRRLPHKWIWGAAALLAMTLGVKWEVEGGFRESYNNIRQKAYLCSSTTQIYTLFGDWAFDLMQSHETPSPEVVERVKEWLAARPALPAIDTLAPRRHCVVILAESLESWVIGAEVEGQVLTPHLNALVADSTTFYAPKVLTQVRGGRSIDCQLMLCAGLLPIHSGAYSALYPQHTYATLPKAMKEHYSSRNYLLTIDKVSTWNQGVIAQSFGIDTIVGYHDFRLVEAFGTHKRTGDRAFLAQCREKIESGQLLAGDSASYTQIITYSGHAPFKLPDDLREVHFSDDVPPLLQDYMATARYTDGAIGAFVNYLKTLPHYKDMLIVITGDHEGLATWREELLEAPIAREWLSTEHFTPFIVLNAPTPQHYPYVMGQIDMYPTLLQMLGLTAYPWQGIGHSVLTQAHPHAAISPNQVVVGKEVEGPTLDRLKQAYDISDLIIRMDLLPILLDIRTQP